MIERSLARSAQESPELAECIQHEDEDCPRCDGGSGYRPGKCCAGCGEPSGRPGQGGRPLLGLRNNRDRNQPMWCLHCHPEFRFVDVL